MSDTIHAVSVEAMNRTARRLIENYTLFVKHAPKMLRQSMMLAYQTAVEDMLKAMDSNKVTDPVKHAEKASVTLLDQNGHAS